MIFCGCIPELLPLLIRRRFGQNPRVNQFGPASQRTRLKLSEHGVWLLLCLGSASYLGWATFNRWIEPYYDFGAQIYCAWLVSLGKWPYLDFAYYNGPFSVWFNGGLFAITGPSLAVLQIANALWLVVLLALLWVGLRQAWSTTAAWFGVLLFIWLFAFSRTMPYNSYNYIAPYAHEHTHGLVLGLLGLVLPEFSKGLRPSLLVFSGLCLGMTFLTKAENSLAATAAAGLWWFLFAGQRRQIQVISLKSFCLFIAAFFLPLLTAFLCLAWRLPPEQALRGATGSWFVVFDQQVRALPLFRITQGTADLDANLFLILQAAGISLVAWLLMQELCRWKQRRGMAALIGGVSATAVAIWQLDSQIWVDLMRVVPFAMTGLLVWQGLDWWRQRKAGIADGQIRWQLVLTLFGTLLLLKIWFNCRTYNYGFALAAVATVTCFARLWEGFGCADRLVWRLMLTPLLISLVFVYHREQLRHQTAYPEIGLGRGGDRFIANGAIAETFAEVCPWVEAHVRPDETLLVFPETTTINYLTRRLSPSRFTSFMPTETCLFGEHAMLDDLAAKPPDWLLIAPKNMAGLGAQIGHGYLDEIVQWIQENYEPVQSICATNSSYAVMAMKRRVHSAP